MLALLKHSRIEKGFKQTLDHSKKMQFLDRMIITMFKEGGTCSNIETPNPKTFKEKVNVGLKLIENLLTASYLPTQDADSKQYP